MKTIVWSFVYFSMLQLCATGIFKANTLSDCPVVASSFCTDDSGNVYVASVRGKEYVDVYKWNRTSWNKQVTVMRTSGKEFFDFYPPSLAWINDTLVLMVALVMPPNPVVVMYTITGSAYRFLGISNDAQQFRYLKRQNDRLVYAGYYDSVGALRSSRLSCYKRGIWHSMHTPSDLFPYEPLVWDKGDTVFVWAFSNVRFNHCLYRITGDSLWTKIYESTAQERISAIVQFGNRILSVKSDSVSVKDINGNILHTFPNHPGISRMFVFKGRLLAVSSKYNITRLYEYADGRFKLLYQNTGLSAPDMNLLRGNDEHLYMVSAYQSNGVYYGSLAEIEPDSLKELSMDTIIGSVFFDANANGLLDAGEPGVKSRIMSASNPFETIETDDSGRYAMYVPWYEKAELDFVPFAIDSCHIKSFNGYLRARNTDPGISRDTLNFPLQLLSKPRQPLRIYNASAFTARIDDTIVLQFRAYNPNCSGAGVEGASAEIVLDSGIQLVWAGQGGVSEGRSVHWSYLDFPNATGTDLQVAVRYPFSRYTLGEDVLSMVYLQTLLDGDTLVTEAQIVQRMGYSYDPNVKQCQPSGITTAPVDAMHYRIDFQNEGNDVARRVIVRDTVSAAFSLAEMQMLGSSHSFILSKRGNVLEWQMPSANLQPESVNEYLSKGYLSFVLPLKATMKIGDSLRNRAFIYFDENEPVVTPYAKLTRQELSGLEEAQATRDDRIYPNPATDKVYVRHLGSPGFIKLYSIYGAQLMQTFAKYGDVVCMDIASLGRGMYLIQLPGGHTEKLVLQ